MSDISKIKLPNGDVYNLKDSEALHQGDATVGAIQGITKQSGSIVTITDAANNYLLEELKISFEPYQSGSGDPSPENVRPITGWTGAKVYRTGKNLCDPAKLDGTNTNFIWGYRGTGFLFKAGISYTLSTGKEVGSIRIVSLDEQTVLAQGSSRIAGITYTPATDTLGVIRLWSTGLTLDGINCQLELGSTPTAYEPYTGETVDVQFPLEAETVYGGTLDVTTGKLMVDRASVDLGTLDWTVPISANPYCFTARNLTSIIKGRENAICSVYDVLKSASTSSIINNVPDKVCIINKGVEPTTGNYPVGTIIIKDSSYESYTKEDFKTAMSGVQLVYELATPITYQLVSTEIRTFNGVNNFWSNIGTISSITYAQDTKSFIQDYSVKDVQIDNTSIVNNGIANIPLATSIDYGVAKMASDSMVKAGTDYRSFLTPLRSHKSTFYGLAKAAGSDMKDSNNAIGTYTNEAKGAIQHMLGTDTAIAPYEADATADRSYAIGDTFMMDGKLYKVTAAIAQNGVITPNSNCVETNIDENYVKDVQINNTSIINNGIANIPIASTQNLGLIKIPGYGFNILANGTLELDQASDSNVKNGSSSYTPIVPNNQHKAVFYGLAKAAGDTTQSASSNEVGTYTTEAKSAIQTMLGLDYSTIASQIEIPLVEIVTGTTITINGYPNTRYICNEVSTLTITPPSTGSIDIVFTSGSTATILTLPSTVKMPEWFNINQLETNTIYEILITDGIYGSVMSWPT